MDGLKTWQKILMVVAAIVFAGSMWLTLRGGGPEIGDHVYLVDVVSGNIYIADTGNGHGVVLPAKHPETGERSLLPLETHEDGTGRISPRYQGAADQILEKLGVDLAETIDEQSWIVSTDIGAATKYARP